MPQLSTVTQKGQITIPISIRNHWELKTRQKVIFVEKEDRVEIKPAVDFFNLKGSIGRKKKYSDKKADKTVGKYLADQHDEENQNY